MVARIQGFPDDWAFSGRKTAAYRQVGNAFPPPVANALGQAIRGALTATARMPQASDLGHHASLAAGLPPAWGRRRAALDEPVHSAGSNICDEVVLRNPAPYAEPQASGDEKSFAG